MAIQNKQPVVMLFAGLAVGLLLGSATGALAVSYGNSAGTAHISFNQNGLKSVCFQGYTYKIVPTDTDSPLAGAEKLEPAYKPQPSYTDSEGREVLQASLPVPC